MKNPDARAALDALIAGADVLVQNLAPGAAARLGLSYEALKPAIPETGRVRHLRLRRERSVRAEEGLRSADPGGIRAHQRHRDRRSEPSRVGISIADIATGMYALTGILSALLRRGRTGEGANVKVAMLDALAEWMTYPMLRAGLCRIAAAARANEPSRHRAIRRAPDQGRPGDLRPAERAGMGDILPEGAGRPELTWTIRASPDNNARRENRGALTAMIEDCLRRQDLAEVVGAARRRGHRQRAAERADGRLEPRAVRGAGQMAGGQHAEAGRCARCCRRSSSPSQEAVMGDVPSVGQHTDEVLRRTRLHAQRDRRDAGGGGDMSEFDPAAHRMVPEQRWFEDFRLGERSCCPAGP